MDEPGNPVAPFKGSDLSAAPANRRLFWALALLPVLLTLLFYLPVLGNGFVDSWDDAEVISNNLHIRSFQFSNLHWMFTDISTGYWMPLTWLSLALDYQWGGLNPAAYHWTNLLLHGLNTLVVFFLGYRLIPLANPAAGPPGGNFPGQGALPAASLAALLFGLHPLNVEVVAWATERKDVLCGLFFLLSLWVYLGYASSGGKNPFQYAASLGCSLLSLMAKPMAVTLPLAFLLLDAWPLKRLRADRARVFLEKAPFFLLSILSGWLAVVGQAHMGAVMSLQQWSLPYRLMNACHSLVFYLAEVFAPVHLAAFYPLPSEAQVFSPEYILSGWAVLLLSIVFFVYRRKRPYLAAVWLFYLVTIAPVAGLLQSGTQAAAVRYAYLPLLGFFLLIGSCVSLLFSNHRLALGLLAFLLAVFMGFGTVRQIEVWRDSLSLWENAARAYPGISPKIQANLGESYARAGRLDEALRAYDLAVNLPPPWSTLHNGRGVVLGAIGRMDEAEEEFKYAVSLSPLDPTPHRNLWKLFEREGKREAALAEIREAVQLGPASPLYLNELGKAYATVNRKQEAHAAFLKAVQLDPSNVEYLADLAVSWEGLGKVDEAVACYKQGIALHPQEPVFYLDLGEIYLGWGMFSNAVEVLSRASQLWPGNAEASRLLGEAQHKSQRLP